MSNNIVTVFSDDARQADITISGSLDIESSGELRGELAGALERAGRVVLHPAGLDNLDITGLQVLCAGCKTAAARQKSLVIDGDLPSCILELNDAAGLHFNSSCIQNDKQPCIWFGGKR